MEKQLIDAIQLAKEAKESGLNAVYMKTYPYVYSIVGETVESDGLWGVVQKVYIKMFQSMELLKRPEEFFEWIKEIIDEVVEDLPRTKNINGGFLWEDGPVSKKDAVESYERICEALGLKSSCEPYVKPVPLSKLQHLRNFAYVSGLVAVAGLVAYIANSL